MTESKNLGRITESRTDSTWGRPAAPVKNLSWFNGRTYTPAKLSIGPSTEREWYTYDATAVIVKGHCAYEPIAQALASEGLVPIKTADGRALASIWFNILRDSVCGAYHEIVVSVDATPTGEESNVRFSATGNPFHNLYNNLGPSVCQQQFLHSLYINSPLSIAWGREMQAFPKHPVPVDSRLDDGKSCFEAEVGWGSDLIVRTKISKRWGMSGLLKEGIGLTTTAGPIRVASFLCATEFDVPIRMPRSTAGSYNVPVTYLAFIRKGKHPTAVRCWPWHADDSLELGEVRKSTDCEENNAHVLLREADYTPAIVTYVPFMQAYVGDNG